MSRDPDWDVYLARVADRFGDNGIVGVAIAHWAGNICEIDTMLLSCRVIGRTVETAFLHFLAKESEARGVPIIEGWFFPTGKNKPAECFYPKHNFREKQRTDEGTLWTFDLRESRFDCPEWIELSIEENARQRKCDYA